jgi:hypothetical protein
MSIPSGSIPMPRSNKPCAPCLPPITRTGSAWAVVKYFREQGLLFPRRVRDFPPCRNHALGTAHPQYRAEASCAIRAMLGRSATDGPTAVNGWMAGSASRPSQRQAWPFLFQNAHVGYITWEDYEANRQQLRQNRQTFGGDRRHGPPREGPALLQGVVICGKCGNRMTIRYHQAEKGTHLIHS